MIFKQSIVRRCSILSVRQGNIFLPVESSVPVAAVPHNLDYFFQVIFFVLIFGSSEIFKAGDFDHSNS